MEAAVPLSPVGAMDDRSLRESGATERSGSHSAPIFQDQSVLSVGSFQSEGSLIDLSPKWQTPQRPEVRNCSRAAGSRMPTTGVASQTRHSTP